ncbi:MAG: hypothetical protein HONBIEJF_00341 [Fimbriimonadaceae bacterium]|nr:hypothetical protein [Fimbriimonadaceae bacterium]
MSLGTVYEHLRRMRLNEPHVYAYKQRQLAMHPCRSKWHPSNVKVPLAFGGVEKKLINFQNFCLYCD